MSSEIEKECLTSYVNDLKEDDLQLLVRQLDAELMFNELNRRTCLMSHQLEAIGVILQAK